MLTRESILAMEPGRELDVLVEERVFGKKIRWMQDEWSDPVPVSGEHGYIIDKYSTDLSDAWEVFELNGIIGQVGYQGDEYVCTLWSHWDDKGYGVNVQAAAKNAPLAICRAALLTTISGEDKQ